MDREKKICRSTTTLHRRTMFHPELFLLVNFIYPPVPTLRRRVMMSSTNCSNNNGFSLCTPRIYYPFYPRRFCSPVFNIHRNRYETNNNNIVLTHNTHNTHTFVTPMRCAHYYCLGSGGLGWTRVGGRGGSTRAGRMYLLCARGRIV